MTNLTEAKLAREAELCYAAFAMITDYDCWHPRHDSVTVDEDHRESQEECRERAATRFARRCGRLATERDLQMRVGDRARDSHRPQENPGGGEEAPRAHHRQIHFLNSKIQNGESMSLLVVGSVAFDAIETPHGKVDRTLGGAASYFALAASHFTPVRVVAIVGEDFTEKDAAVFRGRKIDLAGLEQVPGKTFFWAGRYSQNMNERTTLATELNVFGEFQADAACDAYLDSPYIFLGNIDPTLQRSVLKQISEQAEGRRARYDELLDRRHAGGTARNAQAHANPDDQRRRDAAADRRAQPDARGEAYFQDWDRTRW